MNNSNEDPDCMIADLKMIYFKLRGSKVENGNEQSNSLDITDR